MSDIITHFVWLFDQRFDSLIKDFHQFLIARGFPNPKPILGYQLFPEVTIPGPENTVGQFLQAPPEEINRRFMEAWEQGRLPIPKGSHVVVVAFTMVGLEQSKALDLFGSPPWTCASLNSKISQFRWLYEAGFPLPPFSFFPNIQAIRKEITSLLQTHGAVFLQPEISAGGADAALIEHPDELDEYEQRRAGPATPADLSGFLVTCYIPDAFSLSGHGIVTRNGEVIPLAVDELLLDQFRFDGFIYPIFAETGNAKQILNLTAKAGSILSAKGYWGYFAVDFLCRPGFVPLINEINVRFAGESAFLAAYLHVNLFELLWGSEMPELNPPISRIMITKVRPKAGQCYTPRPHEGTVEAFLEGRDNTLRVCYHETPVQVAKGHFLGLAGCRFPLHEPRQTVKSAYFKLRAAVS
jgi:hypothetical protein